jgi:hypothetical protein
MQLAQMAAEHALDFIDHALPVEVLLFDIKGALLAVGKAE